MSIGFIITILMVNIVAIAIVYAFIRKLPKKDILLFIAISVAIIYILVSVIYWFSGFGIDSKVHENSKNFVFYLFIPYIAAKYYKLRKKQINRVEFINKVTKMIGILLIILIIEFFYFKNIQNNITDIVNGMSQNTTENVSSNEIEKNEISNEILNEIETNQILNEVKQNTTL